MWAVVRSRLRPCRGGAAHPQFRLPLRSEVAYSLSWSLAAPAQFVMMADSILDSSPSTTAMPSSHTTDEPHLDGMGILLIAVHLDLVVHGQAERASRHSSMRPSRSPRANVEMEGYAHAAPHLAP